MPIDLLLDAVETSTGESPLSMRLARNEGRTMMLCELSSNGVVARTYVPVEIVRRSRGSYLRLFHSFFSRCSILLFKYVYRVIW